VVKPAPNITSMLMNALNNFGLLVILLKWGRAWNQIWILCCLIQPGWKRHQCLLMLLIKGEDSFSYFGTHCNGSFDCVEW